MLENFGEKTPSFILSTTNDCFSLMEELKQLNRDKKSREWFEKLRWSKEKINKHIDKLKGFENDKLESINIDNVKYDYNQLKDEIFNLLFMFFKMKNERTKLSENALKAATLLNNNLCNN